MLTHQDRPSHNTTTTTAATSSSTVVAPAANSLVIYFSPAAGPGRPISFRPTAIATTTSCRCRFRRRFVVSPFVV
nr:uncharacterized protein CTRU02_05219 [Colletotrichum truncatum]KAF6794387.1 hypothetical protein CTRU02_05219 [Colletotrichum truncatum]